MQRDPLDRPFQLVMQPAGAPNQACLFALQSLQTWYRPITERFSPEQGHQVTVGVVFCSLGRSLSISGGWTVGDLP